MEYKYFNQFNLSNKLAESISFIISKKEDTNYICKSLVVTIPEHKGLVFSSPLDGYNSWGGGFNSLNSAEINAINKKYSKYVEGTIPAKYYSYLIVMDKGSLETFLKFSFKDEAGIKMALDALSIFYSKYDGTFDAITLNEKFPYLKNFFDRLDEWRSENDRVTLDDDILSESVEKTLSSNILKSKIKK